MGGERCGHFLIAAIRAAKRARHTPENGVARTTLFRFEMGSFGNSALFTPSRHLPQLRHQQHPPPRQPRHPVDQPLVESAEEIGRRRSAQILGPALDKM